MKTDDGRDTDRVIDGAMRNAAVPRSARVGNATFNIEEATSEQLQLWLHECEGMMCSLVTAIQYRKLGRP